MQRNPLSFASTADPITPGLAADLPLVSIVTPSYNQARYLEETIQSVLNQDYPNIEYLIVDGGSTDGSVEIIKRYADDPHSQQKGDTQRRVWWVSEKDQGQTDAINKGFAQARGEILAWINSDDTYLPGAVSEAVAFLQSHPEAGMVYGDANLIDEHNDILGRFPARQTSYRLLRRGYVHIPQQAAFFRAELWRKVGPLDPSFYFAMDFDLWVRIARLAPLQYRPGLWANFRLHGEGKSVIADNRCWPEMLRVHYREGGRKLSIIFLKAKLRPLIYAWLPQRLRLWVRRMLI
jgi:glycosyltransferase involved in cell wall biosynthesis